MMKTEKCTSGYFLDAITEWPRDEARDAGGLRSRGALCLPASGHRCGDGGMNATRTLYTVTHASGVEHTIYSTSLRGAKRQARQLLSYGGGDCRLSGPEGDYVWRMWRDGHLFGWDRPQMEVSPRTPLTSWP